MEIPPDLEKLEFKEIIALNDHGTYKEQALEIQYVETQDWFALAFNIASAVVLYVLLVITFSLITTNSIVTFVFPAIMVWILIISLINRVYKVTDNQKGDVYLESISRKLIVYTQGFHFVIWSSIFQQTVDFQKHETIPDKGIEFRSRDGFGILIDVTTVYRRREGREALSWSLKFENKEIEILMKAKIRERLSELGGRNSGATLMYHKAAVAAWIGDLFGGQAHISRFEEDTGTAILNPVMDKIDLTPESQAILGATAKTDTIAKTIATLMKKNKNSGMTIEEAGVIARMAQGLSTEEKIFTVRGVPSGVTVLSIGGDGIAVAGGGKRK